MNSPRVTLIIPYYRQPQMLRKQYEEWSNYHETEKRFFHFIVVDDCSPEPAEDIVGWSDMFSRDLGIELYRIDEDRPWNRSMARNLGTIQAPTAWIVHMDTDHVLTRWQALNLRTTIESMRGKVPEWFRFSRRRIGAADETRMKDKCSRESTNVLIHPHIDSYLTTKTAYWKAGGYNEDFTGVLGGGSPFLKEMTKEHGEPPVLGTELHVYTRHAVPDSSEHTLKRDDGTAFKNRKYEIMRTHGSLRGRGQKAACRLPWHRVF